MTPRQLRDSANRPWDECPVCGDRVVRRDKPFNTADSDINVFKCNAYTDGTVVCANGTIATPVVTN